MAAVFLKNSYNEEVEALFKRYPSVQNVPFEKAYKPGLERMLQFNEALGRPSDRIKTVHIAGTNGKGSVSNMIAAALTGAGLRTGLYTSPHILDFRERIRLAGELIPKEYVYDFIVEWKSLFEELSLSFFEITTGLALKWFSDMNVDMAAIETGLGGRLDSTNIIRPELCVITNIGLDHCNFLGCSLEKIAAEKAGIFKKGVPALIGEALPETEPVFKAMAESSGAPLSFAESFSSRLLSRAGNILKKADLRGEYQRLNLRTAMAALDILSERIPELMNDSLVEKSLINTAKIMNFHGRWEKISSKPFAICDIGHNAPALKHAFKQAENMLASGACSSLIIVYAAMADKDLEPILPLMPKQATYIFTSPAVERALPANIIFEKYSAWRKANGFESINLNYVENVPDALDLAVSMAEEAEISSIAQPLILICGSTFAVSEAIRYFSDKQAPD